MITTSWQELFQHRMIRNKEMNICQICEKSHFGKRLEISRVSIVTTVILQNVVEPENTI
jgi:hypothetical protein